MKNDSTKALKRFVSLQSKDKSQIQELHQSIQKFPASQSALDNGLQIILNSDLRGHTFKNISTPKKCILGSLDTLVPVKIQDWYEAAGSKTHVLRSGHLPFLDNDFKI